MSEAIWELRNGAGSQVELVMVEVFVAALRREGWQLPAPVAPSADRQVVTVQDHDGPTAPLTVIADW